MLYLIIDVLIIAILASLCLWLADQFVPDAFLKKVLHAVVVVIAVLLIVSVLTGWIPVGAPAPLLRWPR